MEHLVTGRNPVREALKALRPINKIIIAEDLDGLPLREIIDLARKQGIPVTRARRSYLDKIASGESHQGVVALASPVEYAEVEDMLAAADQNPLLVILDGVTDPHNLGAILRTAHAAGARGLIIPRHRAAPLNATVAKASAGAVEYLPVARVGNLVQTIKQLKDRGFWVVGAHMEGQVFWEASLDGPVALVVGGEGKGLGRLLRQECDLLVSIPMSGQLGSLNASVAAALLIYEVVRQRGLVANPAGDG
ncbi:MAG: 23S rRNA (guanosine(2251)-2'-O)-methyltransferase RlmB [Bacillota bacterium]|jgi:23S rRNA (guanosine2251-2'-O)-methyltransferase